MGLVARELERRGIPAVSLSSALSITRSVAAPRAVFLDFPLGRTAGRAFDTAMQHDIVRRALDLLRDAEHPGALVEPGYRWAADDAWKDTVMRPGGSGGGDDRMTRVDVPQYQCEADAAAADPQCPTCIWLAADAAAPAADGVPRGA